MNPTLSDLAVSVVVPALDPGSAIDRTLQRLSECEIPDGVSLEIIISDDGSTDGSLDRFSATNGPWIVVRGDHEGPGGARNRGANASRGDILTFVDCGDEPKANWVTELIKPFKNPRVGIATWAALVHDGSTETTTQVSPTRFGPLGMNSLPGCFAMRRTIFCAIDGYDARLRFGENSDLCERAVARATDLGYEIHRSPSLTYELELGLSPENYDTRRLDAVEYLLERDRASLDERPSRRAHLHAIAAVNAGRCGNWQGARRHAWASILNEPTQISNYVRGVLALCPPIARRRWTSPERRRRMPLDD